MPARNMTFTLWWDETYVEFADNMAEISAVPLTNYYNNIVILRGTSKFFAAPGLRLGYAITGNRDLIKSINTRKNPWTINSLAVVAGETSSVTLHISKPPEICFFRASKDLPDIPEKS